MWKDISCQTFTCGHKISYSCTGIWLSFPALPISQKQLSSLPEVPDKRSEWSRNTDFKESLILPPSFVHWARRSAQDNYKPKKSRKPYQSWLSSLLLSPCQAAYFSKLPWHSLLVIPFIQFWCIFIAYLISLNGKWC